MGIGQWTRIAKGLNLDWTMDTDWVMIELGLDNGDGLDWDWTM